MNLLRVSANWLKHMFKDLEISNYASELLHFVKIRDKIFGIYLQNILKPNF